MIQVSDLEFELNIGFLFQQTCSYEAISINVVGSKLKDIFKEAATSSIRYPNISFIQMARHRISSLAGQGIADFDEHIHKKSTESWGLVLELYTLIRQRSLKQLYTLSWKPNCFSRVLNVTFAAMHEILKCVTEINGTE